MSYVTRNFCTGKKKADIFFNHLQRIRFWRGLHPEMHQLLSMKYLFLSVLMGLFLFSGSGCLKDNSCNPKSVDSERATMASFATANGLTVTEHSSGLQYQIISAGAGATATLSSTVSVRYTGKLMDGTIFDSATGTPVTFPLSQVIPGWQLAVPLIQEGGLIRILVPSSLAYGCTGVGTIPGDAVLYFEIQLVDVQ